MLTLLVICFVLGYLCIALEHPLRLDKTVPAMLAGVLCWVIVALSGASAHTEVTGLVNGATQTVHLQSMEAVLLHHLGKVAEILIFLIGAMTIVELIDLHDGFGVITARITATNKVKLAWIVSWCAFFLSAALDNLTTAIVMVSLLRRLVPDQQERIWFSCLVIIAANAGGAWSPIGDVTTTMLWIADKVSPGQLFLHTFLPSVICLLVPVILVTRSAQFKGEITREALDLSEETEEVNVLHGRLMLAVGVGGLIFVPVFKLITHLPPYMGIMFALGVVWLVSEVIHRDEVFERKHLYAAHTALSRIEMSSVLFFLGILLAVASLESTGVLQGLARALDSAVPNRDVVAMLLGTLSAVVDNVPLVAAAIGMYSAPLDSKLWHFIAYAAGTGGSMLIIGSAAGVAVMGLERTNFIWYLKKISWLAALGFVAGGLSFIAIASFLK
jgi:Na+/H+ antiporter NhaD/arsenite permease-like protein